MKWVKFNIIGLMGFGLQAMVLFALTRSALHLDYLAATAVSVELAVLNNFIWHQRWTWSHRPVASRAQVLLRLLKFNASTGLVSLTGNLLLMSVLVGNMRLPIVAANVLTVVACSLLNYLLADRIAFRAQ